MVSLSLQEERKKYQPSLPTILEQIENLQIKEKKSQSFIQDDFIRDLLPQLSEKKILELEQTDAETSHDTLRVGVVFSGGQAAGGHNVIAGIFDALKKLESNSQLFGFLNGPNGIVKNTFIEIQESVIAEYRNQGGFDLLGSGRTKIETLEQFESVEKTVNQLNLDGLVVIGGDDSNTNAALLAEYFLSKQCKTKVIGVPKTIDGDLKNVFIEASFGFDTASKIYSEIIGNLLRDALSSKKYYFFIKLMGRTASHLVLECALKTQPNMALIGEEILENNKSLTLLVSEISDMIVARSLQNKNYGAILIPEGIVEFIPEIKELIHELNDLAEREEMKWNADFSAKLKPDSKKCFESLPEKIQQQLLLQRDPHGNVQVSKIESETLFIEMVKKELQKRSEQGTFKGDFNPQAIFCGYEGRSGFPSNFDADYCYALGVLTAKLIQLQLTGYMSVLQNLKEPSKEWKPTAVPLALMMNKEMRNGKNKCVIKKTSVDLKGKPFTAFKEKRTDWILFDAYQTPGPIQFFGPPELTSSITQTLYFESLQTS